jgi:hypothetical protein
MAPFSVPHRLDEVPDPAVRGRLRVIASASEAIQNIQQDRIASSLPLFAMTATNA